MDTIRRNSADWTFFSNNTHVIVCIIEKPNITTREIAARVGVTERAVQRIVARLVTADVLKVKKEGRRNHYELDLDQRLRHPLESHRTIGEFLQLIDPNGKTVE